MKKITILTAGSRGDVQPFVALGKGLKEAGYEVKVATHLNYRGLVEDCGLNFSEVTGNVNEALKTEGVTNTLTRGGESKALIDSLLKDEALPHIELALRQYYEASIGADAIVSSALAIHVAHYITVKLDIPLIFTAVNPAGATKDFPHILAKPMHNKNAIARTYNLATHKIYTEIIWKMLRDDLEKAWTRVISPISFPKKDPMKDEFAKYPPLILYGYSPALLPKPKEWSIVQHVVGFLNMEIQTTPDPGLDEFISAGGTPVYIGLGSMGNPDADILSEIIIPELLDLKERMVILTHSKALEDRFEGEDSIYFIGEADFAKLFPKMKLLIHHGGVGTTGLGIGSGVTNLIISFIADQRFWAHRLHQMGAIPKAIPRKKINNKIFRKQFTEAISNSSYRKKTLELSEKLQKDDGIARAVDLISQWINYKSTRSGHDV